MSAFRVKINPSVLIKKHQIDPIFTFGSFRFDFKTIGGEPCEKVSLTKHAYKRKHAITEVLRDFPNSTFDVHQVA